MAPGRAGRLAVVLVMLLAATGCASDDTAMTPKSLRIMYGGDQAMYVRLRDITDCRELADVLAGRSREFVRRGDRTDLGIERAARQQLRALHCETPPS